MSLETALEEIEQGAGGRDDAPAPTFPEAAIAALDAAGVMGWGASAGPARPDAHDELALVRAVARADGSVGRIFDGHLNAIERLAVQGGEALRERDLVAFAAAGLRGGVWGGDPGPGEGEPAGVLEIAGELVLRGTKTFCSGAGGLDRALVLARPVGGEGPPVSAWIDLTDRDRIGIDESWYRSHGLRASVSHRVHFRDAPVLGLLGGPGAIAAQPWFGRDALRTAASWAGMADAAVAAALAELAARPARGELEAFAAGRLLTAQRTIEVWLEAGARAMNAATGLADHGPPEPHRELAAVALHGRAAISEACHTLLDAAARACGSRPFVRAGRLDRARRDLEVFLLQHRLDPLLARAGQTALDQAPEGWR